MDTIIEILHVVGAVFIVGPMAILPMTAMRALRGGDARQVTTLAKSTSVFTFLSILVALFGFGAVGLSDPKYHLSITTPWVLISIILYVIALALSLFLVIPAMRRAASAMAPMPATAPSGGDGSGAGTDSTGTGSGAGTKARGYGAIAGGSGVVALLLVVVAILMVWKP